MKNLKARAALIGTIITALLLIPTALFSRSLIFTADTGNNRIQVFNASGDFITKWGKFGKADGELSSPAGVAAESKVYVVDTGNNRIQTFGFDGTWQSTWGGIISNPAAGYFSSPNSIAVNMEGCSEFVYVADTGNNRIQKFDSEGTWIASWGGPDADSMPGKFNNPQGVAVDPSGMYIYVADTGNDSIQKLDRQGNFILAFGAYGALDGKFKYPRDVAVDSLGRVYVADNMNYRIQRFSSSGVFEMKWGTKGEGNGQFWDHYGLSIDGQDNIYAADSGNNRVQVFTTEGIWVKTIGTVAQGIDEAEFYYPMGVEVYYDKAVRPECMPVLSDTATIAVPSPESSVQSEKPTDTATETYTETFTETATDTATKTYTETFTETPTDTATETYTKTFTETATDTATKTYTETYTETPADTAIETPVNPPAHEKTPVYTAVNTPANTPMVEKTEDATAQDTATLVSVATATETYTETFTESPVDTVASLESQVPNEIPTNTAVMTAVATPAANQIICSLCYSITHGKKVKKTCDMPAVKEKLDKKEKCDNGEKITVLEAQKGGYVYRYTAGGMRIEVYDAEGCYAESVLDMQREKHGKSARHFTAWYVKNALKKNVHFLIPPEYYIALLFPSSGVTRLSVKDNSREFEEMSAQNTYNYPNPCSGSTAIRFSLAASSAVDILISDVSGRLTWQKHLNARETIPGVNYVMWTGIDDRGTQVSNGTYILRVISGDKIVVKKIAIAR